MLPFSCTNMLREESQTEIDKTNYMMNAAEAEVVLLGVYRNMVTDAMYGYHLSILFNIATDIAQVEGSNNNGFRAIPTNSFNTSTAEVQQTWAMLYNSIYNANDFIETLETKVGNYSAQDKELAHLYLAEARGLRGLYYFELVRRYGNVALMTNTAMSNQHPSTFVQVDPVKVYEFIEADLQFAANNLPYAADDKYRKNDFRLSKGGALGLLAKVYATWAGYPLEDNTKWEKAANTAQILIESGKHGLLESYEQLWKNTCSGVWDAKESLMEVTFYAPTTTGSSEDPCGRIGKWNGVKTTAVAGERGSNAGNVKVVHTFVLDWRENHPQDLRRDLSIANYQYNPTKTLWVKGKTDSDALAETNDADPEKKQKEKQSYTPAKWDTEKYVTQSNKLVNNDRSNVNWYVLRYADVLLLYAEALNEWKGAPTEAAYKAVNMVRRRGFGLPIESASPLADLTEGASYTEFRTAVRKERAYELAFEGHRRQDLVRWGIYKSTIEETAKKLSQWWIIDGEVNYVARKFTEDKHSLFPIPQHDMDLTNFKQNPGWF